MAEFVGFTQADAETIAQTRPIIEKHLPNIVADFYDQLLRYPPTRKVFLKPDGTIDQEYVEKRMLFQINFWLRSASGVYDDDYASYVDYVGRAHTSHGADPTIYIAERYVIGMVGFMQRAIDQALDAELHDADHKHGGSGRGSLGQTADGHPRDALARLWQRARAAETFEPLMPVDGAMVEELAEEAFAEATGKSAALSSRDVVAGLVDEIEEGERKIIQVGALSIGVFHHNGSWYARGEPLPAPWRPGGDRQAGRRCADLPLARLPIQCHHRATVGGPQCHTAHVPGDDPKWRDSPASARSRGRNERHRDRRARVDGGPGSGVCGPDSGSRSPVASSRRPNSGTRQRDDRPTAQTAG